MFDFPPYEVTAEEIKEFAQEFDPQPFHLDENSEQAKQVGGLIASGWHTSGIQMRMICDGFLLDSTSQGSPGLEQVRWLNVVRPGDTLSGTAEVVGRRVSKSRPELGIVSFVYRMVNQRDEEVMVTKGVGMFSLKQAETT
ncbi:MAG: MaoC family dehydratase [Rhizobiaceae bacterium]